MRFTLLAVVLSMLGVVPASAVNIPLTIKEALPAETTGTDRVSEPVTIGVPLAEDSGISSITQLALTGSSRAQFKPIGRWPNGNIRWVVIDTLASVQAGRQMQIALTDGRTGNFGGSDLAADNGDYITINTGTATFRVRKANFNFFDEVKIGATALVTSGNAGKFLIRDESNKEYHSANDNTSTAIIEDNGPVKAVIRASGRFRDSSQNAHMGYKVRLTFYYGQSRVKAVLTLCNTYQDSPTLKTFNSLEAVIPLALGSGKSVSIATPSGTAKRALRSSAYVLQSYSEYKKTAWWDQTYWYAPIVHQPGVKARDANYDGVEIRSDEETIASLGAGKELNYTPGWMELADATGKGMTVSFPFMGAWWPAGFEASADGTFRVAPYSPRSYVPEAYRFPFFAQDAREVWFDFHSGAIDNVAFNTKAHYPLVGKPSWEQYRLSKAILGQEEWVTPEEQAAYYRKYGRTFNAVTSTSNPKFDHVTRIWNWGWGGGHNQGDYVWYGSLIDWLRTGYGGNYMTAKDRAIYAINLFGLRTDWDYTAAGVAPTNSRDRVVVLPAIASAPKTPEMEHMQIMAPILWYYLTGDEEAREAVEDNIEMNIRNNMEGIWTAGTTSLHVQDNYIRAWSRKMRNMAYQWEWIIQQGAEDSRLKTYLENQIAAVCDQPFADPYEKGRSDTRGFYATSRSNGEGGNVHSFFFTQIHFEAIYQVYRVLKTYDPNNVRIPDIEEMLGGMAQFFFREYFYDDAANAHWDYDYRLGVPWSLETAGDMSSYSADRAAVWGYIYDGGDVSYLTKGGRATQYYQYSAIGGGATPARTEHYNWFTEAQAQALMYADQIAPPANTWKPLAVSVKHNGGHNYTLSWTVPAGAERYRIKFGTKQIVNYLEYDKFTATFPVYDPSRYMPRYFATVYDEGETIVPGTPGTTQTVTIDVPSAIAAFNSARGRTAGQIGFVNYERSAIYHFDVRCYMNSESTKPLPPTSLRQVSAN